jgi:predicted nucleotidyltransferase
MNVNVQDLTEATASAVKLSKMIGQPTIIVGAFAMAAHGYRRETDDVDIVIPVVIGAATGDTLEAAAEKIGLVVRAKHGFGGLDLRAGDVRIDVVTLDRDVPTLVPDAVKEAVASKRRMKLFGHSVFVVSLGHLVAMKLVAERKKDIADIVELIKVRLEAGKWIDDRSQVKKVVERHLGWYAARKVDDLAATAQAELGM